MLIYHFITKIKQQLDIYLHMVPAITCVLAFLVGAGTYLLTQSLIIPIIIALIFSFIGKSGRIIASLIFFSIALSYHKVKQCENFTIRKNSAINQEIIFIVKSFDILPVQFRTEHILKLDVEDISDNSKYKFYLRDKSLVVNYGDIIKVQGDFLPFDSLQMEGGFNHAQTMAERGFVGKFYCKKILAVESSKSIFRHIEIFRESILERLSRGFTRQSSHYRWFLALAIGNKSFLEYGEVKSLIHSGILHLFAISGLHVAIICGLILFLLRFLPLHWRARYILSPIILFIYVAVAGFSASAVRAWIMITVYYFAKCLLRQVNFYNCLALAALIQLLINPLQLKNSGFQLSFITVFFIIYLYNNRKIFMQVLWWKRRFIPRSQQNYYHNLLSKVVFEIFYFGCVIFLATLGLQAFHFKIIQPLAIINNFWQALLAVALLSCAMIKYFVNLEFINFIITFLLDSLMIISNLISENRYYITVINCNIFLLLCYYFAILLLPKVRLFIVSFATIFLIIVAMLWQKDSQPELYLFVSTEGQSTVLILPATNEAFIKIQGNIAAKVDKLLQNKNVKYIRQLDGEKVSIIAKKYWPIDSLQQFDVNYPQREAKWQGYTWQWRNVHIKENFFNQITTSN